MSSDCRMEHDIYCLHLITPCIYKMVTVKNDTQFGIAVTKLNWQYR